MTYKIAIHQEDGTVLVRDMTLDEVQQAEKDKAESAARIAETTAAKAALLNKLGITEEEAKLLLS